jgi:hypothetical protein
MSWPGETRDANLSVAAVVELRNKVSAAWPRGSHMFRLLQGACHCAMGQQSQALTPYTCPRQIHRLNSTLLERKAHRQHGEASGSSMQQGGSAASATTSTASSSHMAPQLSASVDDSASMACTSTRASSGRATSDMQACTGTPCTLTADMAALHATLVHMRAPGGATRSTSCGAQRRQPPPAAKMALSDITARLQHSFGALDAIGSKLQESTQRLGEQYDFVGDAGDQPCGWMAAGVHAQPATCSPQCPAMAPQVQQPPPQSTGKAAWAAALSGQ